MDYRHIDISAGDPLLNSQNKQRWRRIIYPLQV